MKILFAMVLAGIASAAVAAVAEDLAITNVTVIDGTGAPAQPAMTVLVSGNKITAVAKAGTIALPRAARVVDGSRQFLIPGLWDMHVHVSWTKASALPALVANGVTGVRDMGGIQREIDEWKTKVQNGLLTGPRIYRAGPTVNGKEFAYHQTAATTEAEARAVVRALHKTGVDFIKIHRALPREAYFGLAEESKKVGLAFAGHIPRTVSPEEASDAGQASFEHTETLFEGTFETRVGQA
ncbi:MAG: amidohydrolase family protein, partial [Gammaproteobacteria bacterium]